LPVRAELSSPFGLSSRNPFGLSPANPFGLSLSKPFDRLRANGGIPIRSG
jgi:hypothetical protein